MVINFFYTLKYTNMKTKLKIRIIWESTITKIILTCSIVVILLLAIILPSILTSRPNGSILAFNRDATSGTREAFVEKVIEPGDWDEDYNEYEEGANFKEVWSPGMNVREVRNNDSMITFVQREKNSVGYVSFGTIAYFDEEGNPFLRTDRDGMDNISFTSFEGVVPTKEAVLSGEYSASRNFNLFFRVNEDSNEYQITNYDWSNDSIDSESLSAINSVDNSNDLKAAYFFYNWILQSEEAAQIINESGELSYSSFDDERGLWFNEDGESEKLDSYIDQTGLNVKNNILIEIVGSTSATAVMTDLTNEFDQIVSDKYDLSDEQLKFVLATNGSGDAVSTSSPAGTDHPFIGMQSKDQDYSGLSPWGESYLNDETGEYNSKVYSAFAKDAILIIYNTESSLNGVSLSEYKPTELDVWGATPEEGGVPEGYKTLYDLYTLGDYMSYEDLFMIHKDDGGDLDA